MAALPAIGAVVKVANASAFAWIELLCLPADAGFGVRSAAFEPGSACSLGQVNGAFRAEATEIIPGLKARWCRCSKSGNGEHSNSDNRVHVGNHGELLMLMLRDDIGKRVCMRKCIAGVLMIVNVMMKMPDLRWNCHVIYNSDVELPHTRFIFVMFMRLGLKLALPPQQSYSLNAASE